MYTYTQNTLICSIILALDCHFNIPPLFRPGRPLPHDPHPGAADSAGLLAVAARPGARARVPLLAPLPALLRGPADSADPAAARAVHCSPLGLLVSLQQYLVTRAALQSKQVAFSSVLLSLSNVICTKKATYVPETEISEKLLNILY